MDPHRQHWAVKQQEVRSLLASRRNDEALRLWLRQHAALHAREVTGDPEWSFQDQVLDGLSDNQIRRRPDSGAPSIAWLLWHLARIEDVTMNLLVAGTAQVLDEDRWLERLRLAHRDVGTAMGDGEVAEVGERLDLEGLRAYRLAVGQRTQAIAQTLESRDLGSPVDPARIRALLATGALAEGARGLAEEWSRWTTARFLMMPATRHSFTHLNQASRLRAKVARTP